MTAPTRSSLAREIGVFVAPEYDGLEPFFAEHGFAIIRGIYTDEDLRNLEVELEHQQQRLLAGELPEVCGTVILDDPDAVIDGEAFAHYVCHITEVSPLARDAAYHPSLVAMMSRLLGPEAWLLEDDRFGVVYQDARPGAQSGYSRIGWHSDVQSGPNLRVWPSVACTIHVDATSPCNGFLRIVPGSHRGSTDEMPLGFEHVPGEMAVYASAATCSSTTPISGTAPPGPPTTASAPSGVTYVAGGTAASASRPITASTTSSRTPAADGDLLDRRDLPLREASSRLGNRGAPSLRDDAPHDASHDRDLRALRRVTSTFISRARCARRRSWSSPSGPGLPCP